MKQLLSRKILGVIGGLLVLATATMAVIWSADSSTGTISGRREAPSVTDDGRVEQWPQNTESARSLAAKSQEVVQPEAEAKTLRLLLKPGDTLIGSVTSVGIPVREALAASIQLESVVDLRSLRAGVTFDLEVGYRGDDENDLHLESFRFIPETDRLVEVRHLRGEAFTVEVSEVEHEPRIVFVTGEIERSLYEAARAQNVPTSILLRVYTTLRHAVDFQRDIRTGDTFVLGFEIFDDGDMGGPHPGGLVYTSLSLDERRLEFFRHTTSDGYTGFFDGQGRSIETSLLRTPVDGGDISSLFGKRKHPVLGYTRIHKGLDFAASRGAPVLAAGDGTVIERKRNGGFGKYIKVRHDAEYSTAYAHLSRYAQEIESGVRVRQGDVIGYVGSTGLATGPNLHFEVLTRGRQVNPLTLNLPPRRVLSGDAFKSFRRRIEGLVDTIGAEVALSEFEKESPIGM